MSKCSEPSFLCKQDDPVKLPQFKSTKVPLLGEVVVHELYSLVDKEREQGEIRR